MTLATCAVWGKVEALEGPPRARHKAWGTWSCGDTEDEGRARAELGNFPRADLPVSWAGIGQMFFLPQTNRDQQIPANHLLDPKHLRCSVVVIFSPPRTHPPCTPVTCRSRRFNTVTLSKMFMASRIQTRAFSASARNVSKTLPRNPNTSNAGIGAPVRINALKSLQHNAVQRAAARPAPASDGQRWH